MAFLFLSFLLLIHSDGLLAGPKPAPGPNLDRVNVIVRELRERLEMSQEIRITVTAVNERMVSVERVPGTAADTEVFIMCFDEHFLAELDADELKAAIAHELGHVWIFSHHPYLQTEALANEIAMRVVSRESLERIYTKLWAHLGTSGSLEDFLSAERVQAGH